jgi:hypothetical protein
MNIVLDYFIDFNINCDTAEEAEKLVDIIENNQRFIIDWDLQGVDDDGTPLDGAIISIQLQDMGGVKLLAGVLIENSFEL